MTHRIICFPRRRIFLSPRSPRSVDAADERSTTKGGPRYRNKVEGSVQRSPLPRRGRTTIHRRVLIRDCERETGNGRRNPREFRRETKATNSPSVRNLSPLVSILITHTRSCSDLLKPGEHARGATAEGRKKEERGVGNGQKIGSSCSGQREKMAIPWRRAPFIRYFITTSPTGRGSSIPAVLGGVFRGFAGGNQSGKKLNITPRSKEGARGVSVTVAAAIRCTGSVTGSHGYPGQITS